MDVPVLNGFFIFLNGKTGLKWMLKWVLGGTDDIDCYSSNYYGKSKNLLTK